MIGVYTLHFFSFFMCVSVSLWSVCNTLIAYLCFFSWDFIYAEYVMAAGLHHRSIVWQVTIIFLIWSCLVPLFVLLREMLKFACSSYIKWYFVVLIIWMRRESNSIICALLIILGLLCVGWLIAEASHFFWVRVSLLFVCVDICL